MGINFITNKPSCWPNYLCYIQFF